MHFDFAAGVFADLATKPDAVAVMARDRTLTWQELQTEASAWCERARTYGIGADTPIVIRGHKQSA
ncbi:MAG: D-alanine--poly(phosphoribitol) ligase, partial [Giesbergeria sp.]